MLSTAERFTGRLSVGFSLNPRSIPRSAIVFDAAARRTEHAQKVRWRRSYCWLDQRVGVIGWSLTTGRFR